MKIYAYNIPKIFADELEKEFPHFIPVKSPREIENIVTKDDRFIWMWDDQENLDYLKKIKNITYPSRDIIYFSADREKSAQFVNEYTRFKAEREYIKFEGVEFVTQVPRLNQSFKVVAKVGEEHKGQGKFLMYPGQDLLVKDSVIFEEFLDNAQSFRILLIGESVFVIEYFDDPYNPKRYDQFWIKNINALLQENENRELYKEQIEDTLYLSKKLEFDYLGVDYVKNEEKCICLEVNTFPGVKLNVRTRNAALNYWRNKIKNW